MSPRESPILLHTRNLNRHYIIYTSDDKLLLNEFTAEDLKQIFSPSTSPVELQTYPLPNEHIVSFTTVDIIHFGLKALLIITQGSSSTNIYIIIGTIGTGITLILKLDTIFHCIKIVYERGYILLLKGNLLNIVFINPNNELIFNEFILESYEYYNLEVSNKSGNELPIEIKVSFKAKEKDNSNKRIIGEHIYKITKLNNNNGDVNNNIIKLDPNELNLSYVIYNTYKKNEDCKKLKEEDELNLVCKDKSIRIGLMKYPNDFFAEIQNNELRKYNSTNIENKKDIQELKKELINSMENMKGIVLKYEKELKEKNEFLNL